MNIQNQKTSLITILSSEHGRLRREQRDIDKRDLQRALRYGRKERAWGQRWCIEYDGITFVTDSSMRKEITAYPSPLPLMPIDFEMNLEHGKAKKLFDKKPELTTSHTVMVIDNSGSMLAKKNDVHLYRDSQNAAFSMTALEFVAEQLFSKTAVNSDLLSLVKFSTSASVPIEREPIGWPVYNKILSHRDKQRFVDRQLSPAMDEIQGGSNFLPALEKAGHLLKVGHHEKCALSLFFFSDGQSIDHARSRINRSEAKKQICDKVSAMAALYGTSLTVTVVGLGNSYDDFSVLKEMAAAATNAGAKGSFEFCNKTANSITSAISSLVSSTTETRTALQEGRRRGYTARQDAIDEKAAAVKFDWQYFRILDDWIYDPRTNNVQPSGLLPLAAVQHDPEEARRRHFDPPPFLVINRIFFGKGAERLAFRCRLSDSEAVSGFVFDRMIAKETKDIEFIGEKIEFHKAFMETQDLADYLAFEFNKQLCGLPDYNPAMTPQIQFLNCSILLVRDPDWPTGERGVLVEKMLDIERFPWRKWNDNNGMVDGKYNHVPVGVDFELRQIEKVEQQKDEGGLLAITEEDESDDDDSASEVESDDDESKEEAELHREMNPTDYLQAFTHFTYRYTNRRVMVCDLQGVFNTGMSPPTFELTDPAIHYSSNKGRRMVFGRTDKGRSGMRTFFNTHKCTKICKFLELSGKNKKWRRDWHRNTGQR